MFTVTVSNHVLGQGCDNIIVSFEGHLIYNQTSNLTCQYDCLQGQTCEFTFLQWILGDTSSTNYVYWQDLPDDDVNTGPQGDYWPGRVNGTNSPGLHTLTINKVEVGDEDDWTCELISTDCTTNGSTDTKFLEVYGIIYLLPLFR